VKCQLKIYLRKIWDLLTGQADTGYIFAPVHGLAHVGESMTGEGKPEQCYGREGSAITMTLRDLYPQPIVVRPAIGYKKLWKEGGKYILIKGVLSTEVQVVASHTVAGWFWWVNRRGRDET
jgi:hypothetical protein